jgi:hypothetical protein
MTDTHRLSQPLPAPSWRTQRALRAYRRRRRDFGISAAVWFAFGALCAHLVGCASPCAYDEGCYEMGDFTDTGIGCVDDCLAPEGTR